MVSLPGFPPLGEIPRVPDRQLFNYDVHTQQQSNGGWRGEYIKVLGVTFVISDEMCTTC